MRRLAFGPCDTGAEMLYVPISHRDRVGDRAAPHWELRSVNGQIEYLLREALEKRGLSGRQAGSSSSGGLTRRNSRQSNKS